MEFRKILLCDYMLSDDGRRLASFFSSLKEKFLSRDSNSDFYQTVNSWLNGKNYAEAAYAEKKSLFEVGDETCASFDEFEKAMSVEFIDEEEARFLQESVPILSVELFFKYPEYAFPYLFPRHFYKMQTICKMFDIVLSELPQKKHSERFSYYFKICRALHGFRVRHGLSPTELCVFVYGFAERMVDDFILANMSKANTIYMVHASKGDAEKFLSKELHSDTVTIWQGRPEMMPGDIVLMYEISPYRRIGSVWRAVSPGFDDPFECYPGKVFLGEPVKIPPIGFKRLMDDAVWSKNAAVKAHMQGGSTRCCSVKEYDSMKAMISSADPSFDLSKLPPSPKDMERFCGSLNIEKDVEEKLLEPFLRSIGFSESDWKRQYSIRVGRNNSARPDYVVGLKEKNDCATADFVFEAKLTIPTKRQLRKDFGQVRPYGLMLAAKVIALVSREGVWISSHEDGFDYDKLAFYNWEQLTKAEVIGQLSVLFAQSSTRR